MKQTAFPKTSSPISLLGGLVLAPALLALLLVDPVLAQTNERSYGSEQTAITPLAGPALRGVSRNDASVRKSIQKEVVSLVSFQRVQAKNLKSRRQVIAEVERDYAAKVLKVTLNKRDGVYDVRILQSDGRVRTVRVSAY